MSFKHLKWYIYNVCLVFGLYWLSNLFLWFPWSINPVLGITLMLTVSPLFWSVGIFQSLKHYPKSNGLFSILSVSLLFPVISFILDIIFFGMIRNALSELLKPTTFYGYLFLLILPTVIFLIFRRRLQENKDITARDFLVPAAIGLLCLAGLTLIIVFNIRSK